VLEARAIRLHHERLALSPSPQMASTRGAPGRGRPARQAAPLRRVIIPSAAFEGGI
jgi:hypothetical protein